MTSHWLAWLCCLYLAGAVIAIVGCEDGADNKGSASAPTSSVIDRPGSYPSKSGQYDLTVSVDSNGIVQYEVATVDEDKVLVQDNAGSTYSRWHFYWDGDDRLWVHTGDIGGCLWTFDPDGTPHKGDNFREDMPKPFFDNLGPTMQKDIRSRKTKRMRATQPASQPAKQ